MEENELKQMIEDAKKSIKKDFDAKVLEVTAEAEKTQKEKDAEIKNLKERQVKTENQLDDLFAKVESMKADAKTPEDVNFIGEYQKGLRGVFESAKDESGEIDMSKLRGQEFKIEIKAAALATTSSSLSASQIFLTRSELDNQTYRPEKNPTSILDLIKVVPTKSDTIYWRERVTTEGAPLTTAEAATFPREQLKWEEQSEKVKKIAVFTGFSAEMVEDTDFVEIETPMELKEDIMLVLNTQVNTGDGTGTNLRGVSTIATAFARPAGIGQMANVTRAEVLRIALLQLAKKNYTANAIVLNPSDCALMELEKGTDGHYKMPPFTSADGTKVKGVTVIEDNNTVEGDFLVGDFTKTKLRLRRELVYKVFEQDAQNAKDDIMESTMSMRAALVTPRPHYFAFVKGTFATAITALQAA